VNVANSQSPSRYIDVVYRATPGAGLDYESILDAGQEFSFTAGGITVNGTPTPIAIAIDDDGLTVFTEILQPTTDVNGDGSVNAQDWYALLANEGVTQFRYAVTSGAYAPSDVEIRFQAHSGEAGWRDSSGNKSVLDTDATARKFTIEGPTVRLVAPGDGGQIDIGALQGRGYIDIEWDISVPAGFTALDQASIFDLAPEFALSGPGLGTVKLDAGQAPVLIENTVSTYKFRYWISGEFAADGAMAGDPAAAPDAVTVEFIPGSWSFTNTGVTPSATTVNLTSAQWLTVNFDNVPADFRIDPASITDLAAEFSLSGAVQNVAKNGAGTIALVADVAPQRIGETNSYRFRVSGNFAADGTQSVTLAYTGGAWSYTSEAAATAASQFNDATTVSSLSHSYLDIALTPSVNVSGGGAYTIAPADIPDISEVTLSGNGIVGPPIHPTDIVGDDATPLGNGIYRYYFDADSFQVSGNGMVEVSVAAGAVADSHGKSNRATKQTFLLQGTTGRLVSPADGGLIGLASQNNRGFLDVTFGFPSGKTPNLDTFFDLDAEFSIDAAPGHTITLDGSQAPVLISQTSTTYTFRYFTLGSYTSGAVNANLIAGQIGFTDGSVSTSSDPLAITAPATANVGYIDIGYQPTTGRVLDADAIIQNADQFTLGGAGAGVTVSSAYDPIRLTNSNTFRYFLAGEFAAGEVTVAFALDKVFRSVRYPGRHRQRRRDRQSGFRGTLYGGGAQRVAGRADAGRERRRRCPEQSRLVRRHLPAERQRCHRCREHHRPRSGVHRGRAEWRHL
jgi:hypothetical protein